MADALAILTDGFSRVREEVHAATSGLDEAALTARLAPDANSIAWLIWHLTRIQDDHVADLAGREQVWTAQGFADRFGFPFAASATGYGQRSADVAAVRGVSADSLIAYYDAVHAVTVAYLATLAEVDLDRVVDRRWDPPVTAAVRLVSVIGDGLEHVGQAEFIRGIVTR